jgi:hypothetical protein
MNKLPALGLVAAFSPLAHGAGIPVVQPYRALGDTTPWTCSVHYADELATNLTFLRQP